MIEFHTLLKTWNEHSKCPEIDVPMFRISYTKGGFGAQLEYKIRSTDREFTTHREVLWLYHAFHWLKGILETADPETFHTSFMENHKSRYEKTISDAGEYFVIGFNEEGFSRLHLSPSKIVICGNLSGNLDFRENIGRELQISISNPSQKVLNDMLKMVCEGILQIVAQFKRDYGNKCHKPGKLNTCYIRSGTIAGIECTSINAYEYIKIYKETHFPDYAPLFSNGITKLSLGEHDDVSPHIQFINNGHWCSMTITNDNISIYYQWRGYHHWIHNNAEYFKMMNDIIATTKNEDSEKVFKFWLGYATHDILTVSDKHLSLIGDPEAYNFDMIVQLNDEIRSNVNKYIESMADSITKFYNSKH